jgi:hypothetical protein
MTHVLIQDQENDQKAGYDADSELWKPYNDGNSKIGWGHLIVAGEDFSEGITDEKVDELFDEDFDRAEAIAKSTYDAVHGGWDELPEYMKNVAIDITYNTGNLSGTARLYLSYTRRH